MSAFGRMHKATAIIPLAILSAAWTASLTGLGATTASAEPEGSGVLPDGTALPTEAVEVPASVSQPGVVAPGVPAGSAARAVATASAEGIPEAALLAYQRAEGVINSADRSCRISWQLIAAIGRVESDHGRFGGNTLDDEGVAQPGIFGIPLNGKRNTQQIVDTDAGQYDGDTRWDRAVGPMQFIPSTWSVVGVDGDDDGTRNPQDIDDAALATAVYLCSGDDDLSEEKGQRASVYRYNHSNDYVDLVLEIMQAYLDGDYAAVPTSTTSAGLMLPDPAAPAGGPGKSKDKGKDKGRNTGGGNGSTGGGGGGGGTKTTNAPTPTQTPVSTPTATPTSNPTQVPTKNPTPTLPSPTPTVSTTVPPLPSPTLQEPLTYAEALAKCVEQGVVDNPLTATNELADCANALLSP